jgi:cyclic pyranopterin phosphate synthase
MPQMIDPFGRKIDYLRVSVTDRCNFRCVYCMPEQGFPSSPKDEQLTSDELVRLIQVGASLGIRKVRLTGGEPLLRNDIVDIVRLISDIPEIEDLSCTTNGFLLSEKASALASAGLNRVNISLDTLREDRFQAVARRGSLSKVMDGIRVAQASGLMPVKINAVAMRGINDCEAENFAEWTIREELHVRFIELMPIRWNLDESASYDPFQAHGGRGLLQLRQATGDMLSDLEMRRLFIPAKEIRDRIEAAFGELEEAELPTNGPAKTFRVRGAKGTVGFISQITSDFCDECNRLRLTHDGFLRPCLMSDGELDLRAKMRAGAADADLRAMFLHVLAHKPKRHYLAEGQQVCGRGMSQIGG